MKIGNFDFNVKPVSDEEKEIRKQERKQRRQSRIKYRLIGIGICLIVVFIIAAIGGGESKEDKNGLKTNSNYQDSSNSKTDNSNHKEIAPHNKNFLSNVQNATILDSSYTFKEVFGYYFENPKWRAFHDTQTNQDVVEFTGIGSLNNKDAKILLQITQNPNDESKYDIPYISINDVPVDNSDVRDLLNNALNDYIQNNVHG